MSNETAGRSYAERLTHQQQVWWKRVLPVQLPYRINLRRQNLGSTLDVGCGIGRNLGALPKGSLGIDHNAAAVSYAQGRGFEAKTTDEFLSSSRAHHGSFDSMLREPVVSN